jgi:hypothetical protein
MHGISHKVAILDLGRHIKNRKNRVGRFSRYRYMWSEVPTAIRNRCLLVDTHTSGMTDNIRSRAVESAGRRTDSDSDSSNFWPPDSDSSTFWPPDSDSSKLWPPDSDSSVFWRTDSYIVKYSCIQWIFGMFYAYYVVFTHVHVILGNKY